MNWRGCMIGTYSSHPSITSVQHPYRNETRTDYHRLKHGLWSSIANELGLSWHACEALHWAMGEQEMARRANVETAALFGILQEMYAPMLTV